MNKLGRPKTEPVKREGRWTYRVFMGQPLCYPTAAVSEQDEAVMTAIDAKGKIPMEITEAQHQSLQRILRNYGDR